MLHYKSIKQANKQLNSPNINIQSNGLKFMKSLFLFDMIQNVII